MKLYPYQERWVGDDSRFKIVCKSRQIGYTFAAAYRTVRKRLGRKGLTLWLSASQRQSAEAMEHVRLFVDALRILAEYEDVPFDAETLKLETRLPNGSRIIALPANPSTARGFAGDVVLDEFAFHRDAEAIWRAVFATISRGYDLEVISTPAGTLGKYYELCRAAGLLDPVSARRRAGQWQEGVWSVHWCDIVKAVAEGCPINIAELRAAVADELTWRQEYECEFISDAESLIPAEQVAALENPECPAVLAGPADSPSVDFLLREKPGLDSILYLGGDIGRRQDATSLWVLSRGLLDNLWETRGVLALRGWTFDRQLRLIEALLPGVHRACLDASGLGMQMAEQLQQKWGSKVEPVAFTAPLKEDLAMRVLRFFSERQGRVPFAPWVRAQLTAVKRHVTAAGNIRYDAARTPEGHGDAFWALGLALAAASGPALSTELRSAGRLTQAALLAGFRGYSYGGGAAALAARGF